MHCPGVYQYSHINTEIEIKALLMPFRKQSSRPEVQSNKSDKKDSNHWKKRKPTYVDDCA
jgi:hypothetical protein